MASNTRRQGGKKDSRQAEELSLDSGLDYRVIFNATSNGMAFTEFESGRIIDVNAAWMQSTGIPREKSLGRTAYELGLWASGAEREACLAELGKTGRVVGFEATLVMKSVELLHLISAEAVEMGGRRCLLWEFRDTTEQKRLNEELVKGEAKVKSLLAASEQSRRALLSILEDEKRAKDLLRESEAFRTRVFDASRIPIVVMDAATEQYIDCNSAAVHIYRYACREDVLGKTPVDVSAPVQYDGAPSAEKARFYIEKAVAEGSIVFEWRHLRPDGEFWDGEVHLMSFRSGQRELLQFTLQDITERKRSEALLKESEAMFLKAFEANPLPMIILRVKDLRLVKINEPFEQLLGYQRSEALGHTVAELAIEADPHAAEERLHSFATHNRLRDVEVRYYTKKGESITCLINAEAIEFAGEACAIVVALDITDRKRTEEALRQSENELRESQVIAGLGSYVLDIPTGSWKSSDVLNKLFGIDETYERSIEGWANLVHSDHRAMMTDHFLLEVLGQGRPFDKQYRIIRHNDQQERWVHGLGRLEFDAQGHPLTMRGTITDITDRKRSEQLLARERDRLSVTLRSIGDGVITTDTKGNVVMLNKAAEKMTGWKSEEAAGRPLPEVFVILDELTRTPCDSPVGKVLSTGNIVELASNTCLISKDGREMVIADSGAPIRDNESRIVGAVLVFRDMTEKQKLSDSLQRAQKLESIGVLAGGIAHDFNNLLAGIFGYLDMAKERAAANRFDQIPKYLDKALGVYDRAKGLTQQLLTFSKGGTPIRKTISLTSPLQKSSTFALSGSNVSCQFRISDDLWMSDCDENQIGQVIDNIVINAKQAMPMGGTIIVSADNVLNPSDHTGKFIWISIKDSGIGMPKEILSRIFDPFFSTKETGHGLGLATVYSIIHRHDGWIEVESEPGKGSTFHIFLPASQNIASTGDHVVADHHGSGSILVMDDEEFMVEILGGMLESMGYSVVRAKDGKEAVPLFKAAAESGKAFKACILDLTVPGGMGGKQAASEMRRINPTSIIVASSGYSEDPIMNNPTEYAFTDRITKPYRRNELMELMNRIMGAAS